MSSDQRTSSRLRALAWVVLFTGVSIGLLVLVVISASVLMAEIQENSGKDTSLWIQVGPREPGISIAAVIILVSVLVWVMLLKVAPNINGSREK